MKSTRILTAALLTAALAGCSQEEQFDMLQEAQKEFTGSFEQVASRVTMDSDYMMNWEATTDYVSIFPGITVNNSYQVSSVTDGKATFKFVDYVDPTNGYSKTTGNYNYAVYPYADGNSITADGTITTSVPATIEYDGMENSIQTALMVAKSSNGSLSFKNAQGILRLRLNAQQPLNYGAVKSVQIASAANPLSGAVTITFGEDGLPAATLASEGGKTLTLNLAEALQTDLPRAANSEYAEFYIPIVPTAFAAEDVTMTITWADTEKTAYEKVVTIPFSIERRKIFTLYHTIGATEMEGELEGAEEVWDGVTATTPEVVTDEETGETYYAVESGSDLAGLAALVNGTSTATYARSATSYNFKLTADIDLGGYEWTPIGNGSRSGSGFSGNAYTGVFDGQGFTIKGLTITSGSGNTPVGFIGVLNGGTIKNVNFTDVNINAPSSEFTGAAAGFVTGGGIVDNVTVAGEITASKGVGGIVGRATIKAQILNSKNTATINATSGNAGGIVGAAYYTSAGNVYTGSNAALVIDNCTNNGAVTTSSGGYTGGIVGLSAVRVNNCTNTGAVVANGTSVGGIVGEQKESGEVVGCTNTGLVTNKNSAYGTGGIIGWLRYPASEAGSGKAYEVQNIVNVTDNTNNATINGGSDAGGIVGTVYNYAVVSGNKNSAETLTATGFAAGIVANVQFDTTNANNMVSGEAWKVTITGNHSTTDLASMTVNGLCKSPIAYDNSQGAHTEIANNTTGPITVNTANEFVAALDIACEKIILGQDIALAANQTYTIANGQTVTIDLNNKTLSSTNSRTATNNDFILVKGTLNVTNGTVTYKHTGTNMAWNGAATVFDVTAGGVLNMNGVVAEMTGGTDMNFAVHLNNWGEVTLNAEKCEFKSTYCGVRVFNSGYDNNNVTIKNSTLTGENRAFWVHNYIGDLDASKHTDDAIKERLKLDIYNNGNTFTVTDTSKTSPIRYGFNSTIYFDETGKTIVSNTAGLIAAIKAGNTSIILADGSYTMPIGSDLSLQGKTLALSGSRNAIIDASVVNEKDQYVIGANLSFNGVTLNFGTANYMGFANYASLTYKDCAINGLQFAYGAGQTVFEECDLNSNNAEHSLWTWGGQDISFSKCNFIYSDRAVNCYGENVTTNISFTDCTFTKVEGAITTGAIETNSSTLTALNLTITNCTINEGDLWWVSTWDSLQGANTSVTLDGVKVK